MLIQRRISSNILRIRILGLNNKSKIKKTAFLTFLERIKLLMIYLTKTSQIINDRVEALNLKALHLEYLTSRVE